MCEKNMLLSKIIIIWRKSVSRLDYSRENKQLDTYVICSQISSWHRLLAEMLTRCLNNGHVRYILMMFAEGEKSTQAELNTFASLHIWRGNLLFIYYLKYSPLIIDQFHLMHNSDFVYHMHYNQHSETSIWNLSVPIWTQTDLNSANMRW